MFHHNKLQNNMENTQKQFNQNLNKVYQNSQNQSSQEDYELIPREQIIQKLQKDNPLIYHSLPYKHNVQTGQKINLIQHSSIQSAYENNSQGNQANNINQLEINQSFISKSSSQQNKNIDFPIDTQFEKKLQQINEITKQERQKNFNEISQSSQIQQNYRFSFGKGPIIESIKENKEQRKRENIKIQSIQSQTIDWYKTKPEQPEYCLRNKKEIIFQIQIKENNTKNTDQSYKQKFKEQELQSHLSIEKHEGYQRNRIISQYSKLIEQNKNYNQKLIQSQQQIEFNRAKIDQLRDQLIKSSQNNINALFNTEIHDQVCLIHQIEKIKTQVEGIKNKLGNINPFSNLHQINALHNCQGHRENCYKNQYYQELQKKNRNLSKKYFQLSDHIQNISSNQTRFSQQLQVLKLQFQKGIMQKLENLFKYKLIEQKNQRQIRQIQQFQEFQYHPMIKAQKYQEDEQFDDSRGSINVIYIQRLRQFENLIWEKQKIITDLLKQNNFLKKYLDKLETIRVQQKKTKISTYNKNKQQQTLFKKKHNIFDISESASIDQQKIRQILASKGQQGHIDFVNKKKGTHSFHQSKNIRQKAAQELEQRLKNFQLMIKQKDLRIKELQNTIMDHLQAKNFKNKKQTDSSFSISANSKQQNTQALQHKVHTLKTLLNQQKRQNKKLKLQLEQAYIYNKQTKNTISSKQESQVTKSMCRSQKTIKNTHKNYQQDKKMNPFQQLIQQRRIQNYEDEHQLVESPFKNQKLKIVPFINQALILIQNLRQIVVCFCNQKVDNNKIQNSIRALLLKLKETDQIIYDKIKETNSLCNDLG